MPEYLAIVVVIAGLLVLGSVLLIHTLNKVMRRVESGNAETAEKLAVLTKNIAALQDALHDQGQELTAIRSEVALHLTRRESGAAEYALAVKAASSGKSPAEVEDAYGLREAEAQLLVAVHGGAKDN